MRYLCFGITLLALTAPLSADELLRVRVLYCGDHGSGREADFHSFLASHFTKVTLRDLREFKEADANGHDVVIFDWTNGFDGKGHIDQKQWQRLRAPKLSRAFARPTILIGRAGGEIATPLKLKINWFCLCLEAPAHHLALDHPLFHSPLEVNPKLEQMPTPEDYPYLTLDAAIGPTMNVWKVQKKDYPEIDPGLVSFLYGFSDSPDAEVIAQGIADKGPDTVALGRQANFFLWGFSASPADMTSAGRRLFVNAVCYMPEFDGQTPLVRNEARARRWALRWAVSPRFLSDDYKQREIRRHRALITQHAEWVPERYKGNVDAYLSETVRATQAGEKKWMEQVLPKSLRNKFGMGADKYVAYYKENLEYLRPTEGRALSFDVDEDAKSVGPSNRSVELLARCVSMLERNEQSELALRLLKRYTQERFETASRWRIWLDANRSRLFFSDVGGYKFFAAPTEKPAHTTPLSTQK